MKTKELARGIKYGLWSLISPRDARSRRMLDSYVDSRKQNTLPSQLEKRLMIAGTMVHILATLPYQIYCEKKMKRKY